MKEEVKTQLIEVVAIAMGSLKKEHSDLMYQILTEMKESRRESQDFREESRAVMAQHKLDDQKSFGDLQLKLNTLEQQTMPIHRAWSQAITYAVAAALGAIGIKMMK